MAIQDTHPLYAARLPDWELLADAYEGERAVKERGEVYLPPTAGMRAHGYGNNTGDGKVSTGQAAYNAYRIRALYHWFVRIAVQGLLGVIHRKPPQYENVPAALQSFVDSATLDGEKLDLLWQRISAGQLHYGRLGCLVDVPDKAEVDKAVPYVALYTARAVRNWGTVRINGRRQTKFVVLDESENEDTDDLSWEMRKKYRVLGLAGRIAAGELEGIADGEYMVATFKEGGDDAQMALSAGEWIAPSVAGKRLTQIPFVFVNPNDLVVDPDLPPLLGLANLTMAIYRGEADYRQSLFLQGQDTLVRIGASQDQQKIPVGAGAAIEVPMGGDAKFIGVSSSGLSEQRQALENDKKQASEQAVQLLDTSGGPDQSGEALRVRVGSRTATLKTLQLTAAGAVRDCLRYAGRFLGLDEAALDAIVVTPNLDFSDAKIDAASVKAIVDAKATGRLPLAARSIWKWLRDNEYTDLATFEEEMEAILEEAELMPTGETDADIDPAQNGGGQGDGDEDLDQPPFEQ